MEAGEQIVVGVNEFIVEDEIDLEPLKVDPAIEELQRTRLVELRQKRDSVKTAELLAQLDSAARGQENMMPLFIECMQEYITLGEICAVLRSVWGEYQPGI